MEEWEKKLKDLEAEVDQDFAHRAKEAKEQAERDRTAREDAARQAAARKKTAPQEAASPLTALTTAATTKAVKAAAEQSLMTVGPRKAAVYGAAALFLVWLLMRNLGIILLGTGALGALYYFLVVRAGGSSGGDGEDEDDAGDEAHPADEDD